MGDHMEIGETGLIAEKDGLFYDTNKKKIVDLSEDKKDNDETKED